MHTACLLVMHSLPSAPLPRPAYVRLAAASVIIAPPRSERDASVHRDHCALRTHKVPSFSCQLSVRPVLDERELTHRDIAALWTQQKADDGRDLLRMPQPAQRDRRRVVICRTTSLVHDVAHERGVDCAWRVGEYAVSQRRHWCDEVVFAGAEGREAYRARRRSRGTFWLRTPWPSFC